MILLLRFVSFPFNGSTPCIEGCTGVTGTIGAGAASCRGAGATGGATTGCSTPPNAEGRPCTTGAASGPAPKPAPGIWAGTCGTGVGAGAEGATGAGVGATLPAGVRSVEVA